MKRKEMEAANQNHVSFVEELESFYDIDFESSGLFRKSNYGPIYVDEDHIEKHGESPTTLLTILKDEDDEIETKYLEYQVLRENAKKWDVEYERIRGRQKKDISLGSLGMFAGAPLIVLEPALGIPVCGAGIKKIYDAFVHSQTKHSENNGVEAILHLYEKAKEMDKKMKGD